MSLRWALTWKPSAEQENDSKAKERIVIRGYQHQSVTNLEVSSPTLSRLGKMLALQWAALNRSELECADTTCALLQRDGQSVQESKPAYANALDEIARAIKNSIGRVNDGKSRVRTWTAPRSGWVSVDRFLTAQGGKTNEDRSNNVVCFQKRTWNNARVGCSVC